MCNYCDITKDVGLSERKLSNKADVYVGIGCYITDKTLEIEAFPDERSAFDEISIAINYCPICGRKL